MSFVDEIVEEVGETVDAENQVIHVEFVLLCWLVFIVDFYVHLFRGCR